MTLHREVHHESSEEAQSHGIVRLHIGLTDPIEVAIAYVVLEIKESRSME